MGWRNMLEFGKAGDGRYDRYGRNVRYLLSNISQIFPNLHPHERTLMNALP